MDTAKRINTRRDRGDYKGARRLIRQLLKRDPQDHWLMTKMAQVYSLEGKMSLALQWSRRAIALAPSCPLALWDYAGINWQMRRNAAALRVWEGLIKRGAGGLTRGSCGRTMRSARKLVADCHLMIGWYYEDRGDVKAAIRKYRVHFRWRESGSGSVYSMRETRQELRQLEARAKS